MSDFDWAVNIAAPLCRVKQTALIAVPLLALLALVKLMLTHGVELGKDEAAYWYWSLDWDFTYAPLPFAVYHLAHALVPGAEWSLRLGQVAAGMLAVVLMFRWCRGAGLDVERSLWATAAFATSHWIWHTSSFLHPDGFLVPCWLLVLVCARRAADRRVADRRVADRRIADRRIADRRIADRRVADRRIADRGSADRGLANREWTPWRCALLGVAAALTAYCKYSGVVLAASLFVWLAVAAAPGRARARALGCTFLPFAICLAPLVLIHWADGFRLPLALGSLSRIAGDTAVVTRLGLFALAPLLFVSPILLWLLYRALGVALTAAGSALRRARPRHEPWMPAHRHLMLPLIPALALVLCFGFFAVHHGQIKGNWILPAFLALWPGAGGARLSGSPHPARRAPGWLLALVVAVGLVQATAAGMALRYPGAAGDLVSALGGGFLDDSYPRLVSAADRAREPTHSWSERMCEYAGWRTFTADLEAALARAGLPASTALVSTQYDVAFTTAYYADAEAQRPVYTVADPRFRRLSDLRTATPRPDTILFVARAGAPVPTQLDAYTTHSSLPALHRGAAGCGPVAYELTLLVNAAAMP